MTYDLTPRALRLQLLRKKRDQLDAEIQTLIAAELDDAPSVFPFCGSEKGYKKHRSYGEQACVKCKRAHSAYEFERKGPGQRRSPKIVPPCGTESGYQRHKHRKENCDACREAHNTLERIKAARKRAAS